MIPDRKDTIGEKLKVLPMAIGNIQMIMSSFSNPAKFSVDVAYT